MDNLIHQKLEGRYEIQQILGAGGMANVYKGIDLETGNSVAVKVLKKEFVNNPELVRRFKNEAKAISLLNHPNITQVYDVNVSNQEQYIIMEYIEGITLKEYMQYRERPLTVKESLHFSCQILAGLQHAHEKGIVHRDIKPQNIMLLRNGSIKIMDFGIARFSRSESRTLTDKAIGSVHYISPEQARGNVTDVRADIYSVGVMMYEMLAGKLPFESDSPVTVAIKQISEEATPLRELNPSIPQALAAIIARAMAKSPGARYACAREMKTDLEEFKKNPKASYVGQRPQPKKQPVQSKPLSTDEPTILMNRTEDTTTSRKRNDSNAQRTRVGAVPSQVKKAAQSKRIPDKKASFLLPILAGIAAAFALGAGILIWVIFHSSSSDLFQKRTDVELPNFTNLQFQDIKNNEQYKGFHFEVIEQYNAQTPVGVVFKQSPKPPKTVKDNATIKLYISKGAQVVSMPNLIGKSKKDAVKILSESGLLFRIETEQTKETTPGNVIRTTPQAGTRVRTGSLEDMITVVISREQVQKYTTPAIVGQALDDVTKKFEQAEANPGKFRLGTVTEQDDKSPKGTILSQVPEAGAQANKGTSINVVVSSGAVPVERIVTVHFDETVDEGDWSLVLEGGATATYHTTAGKPAIWPVAFTDTGVKALLLRGPQGDLPLYKVDFTETGTDLQITAGGSYRPPAPIPPPVSDPVLPPSSIPSPIPSPVPVPSPAPAPASER